MMLSTCFLLLSTLNTMHLLINPARERCYQRYFLNHDHIRITATLSHLKLRPNIFMSRVARGNFTLALSEIRT